MGLDAKSSEDTQSETMMITMCTYNEPHEAFCGGVLRCAATSTVRAVKGLVQCDGTRCGAIDAATVTATVASRAVSDMAHTAAPRARQSTVRVIASLIHYKF